MNAIKHLATATFAVFCIIAIARTGSTQSSSDKGAMTQGQLNVAAARADRKTTVSANMQLSKAQADAFWPLYDAYEGKMDRIEHRHAAEVKAFVSHYQTLTDADADKKLDEVLVLRQERLDVQKEFVPKFRAAVSSINTTRFFQIDNKLNAMIQCALAQALPLASPGAAGKEF